jgi:phosphoribosyl-ATP pyrophosphohydrolase
MSIFTLESLAKIIAERARAGGEGSYTRQLLDGGVAKCAKKLGEEATETALAAVSGEDKSLVAESADLLYHLLVLLESRGVALAEVYAELERRTARSGLEEKASRRKD